MSDSNETDAAKSLDVTMSIDPAVRERMKLARVALSVATGQPAESFSDADMINLAIMRGLESLIDADQRHKDHRPIGELSVAQLGELFGVIDLEGARRRALAAYEYQVKASDAATQLFNRVEGLRESGLVEARTVEQLTDYAARLSRVLQQGKGQVHLLLASGIVVTLPSGEEDITPIGPNGEAAN